MHCYIISPSLWQTTYSECRTVLHVWWHLKKGTSNTSFVLAALASCTFQIIVQYPVSYIQGTEWNSIILSKWSDMKIYNSENVLFWVLFTFVGTKSHTAMYREKSFRVSALRLWNELPDHIKLAASRDIFCKVLKTHLFKLAYL